MTGMAGHGGKLRLVSSSDGKLPPYETNVNTPRQKKDGVMPSHKNQAGGSAPTITPVLVSWAASRCRNPWPCDCQVQAPDDESPAVPPVRRPPLLRCL